MKTKATSEFEVWGVDKWKNKFVLCPVCKVKCKEDGAIKHMIQSGRMGDISHAEWISKNYKPTRNQKKK